MNKKEQKKFLNLKEETLSMAHQLISKKRLEKSKTEIQKNIKTNLIQMTKLSPNETVSCYEEIIHLDKIAFFNKQVLTKSFLSALFFEHQFETLSIILTKEELVFFFFIECKHRYYRVISKFLSSKEEQLQKLAMNTISFINTQLNTEAFSEFLEEVFDLAEIHSYNYEFIFNYLNQLPKGSVKAKTTVYCLEHILSKELNEGTMVLNKSQKNFLLTECFDELTQNIKIHAFHLSRFLSLIANLDKSQFELYFLELCHRFDETDKNDDTLLHDLLDQHYHYLDKATFHQLLDDLITTQTSVKLFLFKENKSFPTESVIRLFEKNELEQVKEILNYLLENEKTDFDYSLYQIIRFLAINEDNYSLLTEYLSQINNKVVRCEVWLKTIDFL